MSLEKLNKVWEVQQLKKMPEPNKALDLLNRLVKSTEKLLTKYKWKVKTLKEFYPNNKSLLGMNVNHGASILIRLRSPNDNKTFLPWHDILGTMCHELAHMNVSPHNAAFYKLWDELSSEVEKDGLDIFYNPNSNNSVGATLIPNGTKLGGQKVSDVKDAAATAALKRQRLLTISQGSGQKLGGNSKGEILNQQQLKELIRNAAERRFRDDKWCPAQRQDDIDNQSIHKVISKPNENDKYWECLTCLEKNKLDSVFCSFCGLDKDDVVISTSAGNICKPCINNPTSDRIDNKMNNNEYKSYHNYTTINLVDNFNSLNNSSSSSGKTIQTKYDKINSNAWICDHCTFENLSNTNKCEVCEIDRYKPQNIPIDLT